MIYARVTVGIATGHPNTETFIFTNIVDCDIGYYDDRFFSRIGYADFSLTFAHDPSTPQPLNPSTPVACFSLWWQNLNKNPMPPIQVEFIAGEQTLATGRLTEWTEDRDACEIEWTCIDSIGSLLDQQITAPALTVYSQPIETLEQPPGPGSPGGDLPPIFPPGTPSITYAPQLREFFWNALCQWWNTFKGSCPPLSSINYSPLTPFTHPADSLLQHINAHLQTRSNETYRVAVIFKKLENVSRKETLSQLAKLTQYKITCNNGIHIGMPSSPTPITGYIASINNVTTIDQPDPPYILQSVILQYKLQNVVYDIWRNIKDFTNDIINISNSWLYTQSLPRNEYNIWGYAPTPLTSGDRITLNGQTYTIKDIAYEPETMHTICSFEAVCVLS